MHHHSRAVLHHGEMFSREEKTNAAIKGSIISSTRATFSLANRACYFEGLIQKGTYVGEYLTRAMDDKKYMVNTLHIQPRSPGLEYIFMAMCNQIVTIARPNKQSSAPSSGDGKVEFNIIAKDVLAFIDITTRSLKSQNDGLTPDEITVIHIPSRFGLKRMDRIYVQHKDDPLEDCAFHRVDSINDALSYPGAQHDEGVEIMQLSDDRGRGAVIVDPTVPTDPDPIDEEGWWD